MITTPPISQEVKTSIFYINDVHGQVPKMEHLKMASDCFTNSSTTQKNTDFLKVSSGDIMLGSGDKLAQATSRFLESINLDALTLGNHEFDHNATTAAKLFNNVKSKVLTMNLNFPENSMLKSKSTRSTVIEKNGHKYGIIGLQPIDLLKRINKAEKLEGITVDNAFQTFTELQEEVNILKEKGVNKIILLSHTGYMAEKLIAQKVSGIDVILGGHSHHLIKGVEKDKNLFYSPSGEPVVITQAGRDGKHFGILNLTFDKQGRIKSVQNNITKTTSFPKSIVMKFWADKILGKSEEIGTISKLDSSPSNYLAEENVYADFFADAMKSQLGGDIALINSGNFRGDLAQGDITTRDISSLSPFKNNLCKVKITEEELVNGLKIGAKSLATPFSKPGIIQVSGIRYTINKKGEFKEAFFVDKNNNQVKINIQNPSKSKTYVSIMDDYMAKGPKGFEFFNKIDTAIEKYNFDKSHIAIEQVKSFKDKPFEMKKDGRIKIVD